MKLSLKSPLVYVLISETEISLKEVSADLDANSISVTKLQPVAGLESPDAVLHSFSEALRNAKDLWRTLNKKLPFITLRRPIFVVHFILENGLNLSPEEKRAILELFYDVGARKFFLCEHPEELSPVEVRKTIVT